MVRSEPPATTTDPRWARPLKAAAVGCLLAALAQVALEALVSSRSCRDAPGFGCLGLALFGFAVSQVLIFLLSWVALRLLRIASAGLVALIGAGLGYYLSTVPASSTMSTPSRVVLYGLAYALAAILTWPLVPARWRLGVAAALILLYPVSQVMMTTRAQDAEAAHLAHWPVALLGPQIPSHYELVAVGTDPLGPTFSYRVVPDTLGNDARTIEQLNEQIQVIVGRLQPGFSPPAHCQAVTDIFPIGPGPACTPVAPGVWKWASYHYIEYFSRVGNAVAVTQGTVPPVEESVLRHLAATMRVRSPSYFTGH